MWKILVILSTLLVGCSHDLGAPDNSRVQFRLKLVDTLPTDDKSIAAITTCKNKYCEMLIDREYYPGCVAEEVIKLTHGVRDQQTFCYRK